MHRITPFLGLALSLAFVSVAAFGRVSILLATLGSAPLRAEAAEAVVVLTSAEAEPYQVALQGIQEALAKSVPNMQIQTYALNDASQRDRLLAEIRSRQPPLVMTLGSTATTLAQAEFKSTPVVFCMVLNPQAGGLVQSMQSSGNNLTGASLDIPIKLQFEALHRLVPSVKRIGVFYNPAETEKVVQPAVKIAAGMGLDLIPIAVTPPEQLGDLADTLRSRRLDALWAVADSTVFASSRSVEFLLKRALE